MTPLGQLSARTIGGDHSQWLERGDTELLREKAGDERQDRRAGLARARNISRTTGHEPRREDGRGVVHEDGEHGSKEKADERDSNRISDERRDEPDYQLKPAVVCEQQI